MTVALKAKTRTDRAVWDATVYAAGAKMQRLAQDFTEGKVSEADYVLEMRSLVKSMHMGATALAAGGVGNVTKRELRQLGPLLRDQYKFLQRRVGQFQSGEATAAQVVGTVAGYADHALLTYENAARARAPESLNQERRFLTAAESCDDCEREAAKGWQPRGSLRAIGDSACKSRCRCGFQYRATGE